jgi:hypothetical protein
MTLGILTSGLVFETRGLSKAGSEGVLVPILRVVGPVFLVLRERPGDDRKSRDNIN